MTFVETFVGGLVSVLSPSGLVLAAVITMFLIAITCARNSNRDDNSDLRPGIVKYALVFSFFYTVVFVFLGTNVAWLIQSPEFRPVATWVVESKEVIVLVAGLALTMISLRPYFKGKSVGFFGNNWFAIILAALGGVYVALSWAPAVGPILAAVLFEARQSNGARNFLILYSIGRAVAFLILPIIAEWLMTLLSGRQRPMALCGVLTGLILTIIGLFLKVVAV